MTKAILYYFKILYKFRRRKNLSCKEQNVLCFVLMFTFILYEKAGFVDHCIHRTWNMQGTHVY